MNKFFLTGLFVLSSVISVGQNLVPNGSFEDTLTHLNCITEIEIANHWFNPTAATPDLYTYKSSCLNTSLNNPSGFQMPRTGLAYAGIYGFLTPTREYIAIKIDTSLTFGETYFLEFYVSLANEFGLACDKIGAAFTNDTTGFYNISQNLPLITIIESMPGYLLTDTANWIQISGAFTATGNEYFLLIGNFYDDTNTFWDTVNTNGLLNSAYYYIDDVCLSPDSTYCQNWTLTSEVATRKFTIYPNPADNFFHIESSNAEKIFLRDMTGKIILEKVIDGDSFSVNTSGITPGIYILGLMGKDSLMYNQKLLVEH